MSLALDYSSDDAELAASVAKDAFGIASLAGNKRPRVEEPSENKSAKADAAPHVLAEASFSLHPRAFQ
jgi:pre-mRNA-processing factor 17